MKKHFLFFVALMAIVRLTGQGIAKFDYIPLRPDIMPCNFLDTACGDKSTVTKFPSGNGGMATIEAGNADIVPVDQFSIDKKGNLTGLIFLNNYDHKSFNYAYVITDKVTILCKAERRDTTMKNSTPNIMDYLFLHCQAVSENNRTIVYTVDYNGIYADGKKVERIRLLKQVPISITLRGDSLTSLGAKTLVFANNTKMLAADSLKRKGNTPEAKAAKNLYGAAVDSFLVCSIQWYEMSLRQYTVKLEYGLIEADTHWADDIKKQIDSLVVLQMLRQKIKEDQ